MLQWGQWGGRGRLYSRTRNLSTATPSSKATGTDGAHSSSLFGAERSREQRFLWNETIRFHYYVRFPPVLLERLCGFHNFLRKVFSTQPRRSRLLTQFKVFGLCW